MSELNFENLNEYGDVIVTINNNCPEQLEFDFTYKCNASIKNSEQILIQTSGNTKQEAIDMAKSIISSEYSGFDINYNII